MKNNAKLKLQIVLVLILTMVLFIIASFALFSTNKPFDLNLDGGDLNAIFTENIDINGSNIFTNKGDKYQVDFEIENAGSCAFQYDITLTLTAGGLEDAVLLYIDGKFVGTLSQLFLTNNTISIPINNPLYIGEKGTHKVELEYHIGAGNYYSLTNKDFGLKIGGTATQVFRDINKIIYIENNYQLLQIINNFNYTNYTIQLVSDITLNQNIAINKPLSINLAGHNLNMANYSISYDYSDMAISRLFDSRSDGSIYGGNISADTPNALVLNEKVLPNSNFVITSADFIIFKDKYDSYLKKLFMGGIKESMLDIRGIYEKQLNFFGMNFLSGDLTIINSSYEVTRPDYTEIVPITITFSLPVDSLSFEVDVWGNDNSSIAEQIVQDNFFFLDGNFDETYVSSISRDILLPTKSRMNNSKILWISSNRDVISEEGKYNAPYINTELELTAIISFNGVNILRTFKIIAIAKTPQEKLREICLLHGVINFVLYTDVRQLPTASDYSHTGVDSLTYSLPASVVSFFQLDHEANTLSLVQDTDIESTFINVEGVFGDIVVNDIIEVRINILRNISYWDAAYNYLISYVSQVPDNTLDGFEVPNNRKEETTIEYIIIPGSFGEYENTLDVQDYIKVIDNKQIKIIKEKLPADYTSVTVKVVISYDTITEERYFTFNVGGIVQYGRDIEDINLYQELRKLYDIDNDWHITRDEIELSTLDTLTLPYHNISSIKGIKYFTKLKNIDLSYNKIMDIEPLTNIYALENLNLSYNFIQNITPLSGLTLLNVLNLAGNGVEDISGLAIMQNLVSLYLNGNLLLSDLSALQEMPALLMVTTYDTQAVTDDDAKNENVFLSAYQNAFLRNGSDYTAFYRYNSSNMWKPTNTQITASKIINYIIPIYEFSNVIYLPYTIKYEGTNYIVRWNTNNESIINIDNNRAYITQPIADISVSIDATIEYGGFTLKKFFKVLSRGDERVLSIYNGVSYVDAITAIPDNTLRYNLFEYFDTDKNGIIDNTEIIASKGDIDFSGLGIKDIEGLQYFNGAITNLDLRNNDINSLSALQYMTNLNTLAINNKNKDFSAILSLRNLNILNVYGLENINSNVNLGILYETYINNAGITIFKDSLNDIWNPYIEPMTKALRNVEGTYLIYPGNDNRIDIVDLNIDVVMYNGDIENVDVSYTKERGAFGLLNSNTVINLNHNAMRGRDEYGLMIVTISIGETVVTRYITVISISDYNLYIEVGYNDSGEYELLTKAVPNETARRAFIGRLNNTNGPNTDSLNGEEIKYISYSAYMSITTITFDAMAMSGVKGLEYLKGGNLNTITLNGYVYKGKNEYFSDEAKYKSLSTINSADFPLLKTITLNYSVVDLFELVNITDLTDLVVYRCSKIIMDRMNENDERESVFSYMTELSKVYLHNNDIRDFWAVSYLQKVTDLTLYANGDASVSTATDNYVEDAYANLPFGTQVSYQVIGVNIFWESRETIITDLNVTIGSSLRATPSSFYVNYVTAGQTATLPLRYKSTVNNVVWTAKRGENAYNYYANSTSATITFKTPTVAAYIVLVGTVSDFVSVEYIFLIKSNATNSSYLPLSDFMEDGELADNNITNLLLGEIAQDYNGLGIYRITDIKAIETIDAPSTLNQTATKIYRNIKGIKNFSGVKTLNLSNHSISNIEELYNMEGLITLRMFNNIITSLVDTVTGNSIFYKMNNLEEIQLQENPGIPDFYPIAQRQTQSALKSLRTINIYQSNLTYAPAVEDEDALQSKRIFDMVRTWWAQRKSIATNASLTFLNGQTHSNNARIVEVINAMNVLDSVVGRTDVKTGINLGASKSIDIDGSARIYPLYWRNYGNNIGISVTDAGIVESIDSTIGFTNHTVKMRVFTYIYGTSLEVSKFINVSLAIDSNLEDNDLVIEITHAERIGRYSGLSSTLVFENINDATKNIYTVSAKQVLPDNTLRNHMFSLMDKTPFGVLSISERAMALTTLDITDRNIEDITGIDLFTGFRRLILTSNKIKEIPQMYIPSNSRIYELVFYRNTYLKDISNLSFVGGAGFVSIGSLLTRFDIRDCYSLDDEQMKNLAVLENIDRLYMTAIKISDYSCVQPLYKTLTLLYVNNYRSYANNNNIRISKTILDSYKGMGTNNITGLNSILVDLVRLNSQYEADGTTPYLLPQKFKLGEYDKEYDLIWTVPTGTTDYNISESDGKYYLTIGNTASAIINIDATVTYFEGSQRVTYSETFEVVTTQEPDLEGLYSRLNGQIWSRFTSTLVDIEMVVPDPIIRYYFFKIFDSDNNGIITEAELKDASKKEVRFYESYPFISSFEGIEYLFEPESLFIRKSIAYDNSNIGQLTTLKSLNFYDTLILIDDISFLEDLINLETLNLDRTGVTNFGFVMTNNNILEITNLGYASRGLTQYTLYTRNAWAYARGFNNLSDDPLKMGDVIHENIGDEKLAAMILNQIPVLLANGNKQQLENTSNTIELASSMLFREEEFEIQWKTLSTNVDIEGGIATITPNNYVKDNLIVARIVYNGASYERLFSVRYAA